MNETDIIFVDTTILIELIISPPDRSNALRSVLERYSESRACSFSKLEFKRALLQRVNLALRYLEEEGFFAGALRRTARNQYGRVSSTLNQILAWVMEETSETVSVEEGDDTDAIWTEKAKSYLRNSIQFLWYRFDSLVNEVVDETKCKRAREAPERANNGNFNLQIHEQKCGNQTCNNAGFFQTMRKQFVLIEKQLAIMESRGLTLSDELKKARAEIKSALGNSSRLYNYRNCLNVGDVWIHLEALSANIRNLMTTNYKESQILCSILNLQMLNPKGEASSE